MFILCIFIFASGCHNNSTFNENTQKTSNDSFSESRLNGYWILSDYFDSILFDKSIAKNRMHEISWAMFVFEIRNDSLRALGLVYPETKFNIKQNKDTLLSFANFGEYYLHEDKISGNILANQTKPYGDNLLVSKTYHYRRVIEPRLTALLNEINVFKIQQGLIKIFADSLIVGEYEEIGNRKLEKISFYSNGEITGFKKFKKYHVNSYFGTYHPFENYDEIFLESENNKAHYNWKFNGDTLRLTELLSKNGDEYYIGKKSYFYRKTVKHSP
jgi:hypothetical protein